MEMEKINHKLRRKRLNTEDTGIKDIMKIKLINEEDKMVSYRRFHGLIRMFNKVDIDLTDILVDRLEAIEEHFRYEILTKELLSEMECKLEAIVIMDSSLYNKDKMFFTIYVTDKTIFIY